MSEILYFADVVESDQEEPPLRFKSLYFALFISLTTTSKNKRGENKENRVLHIVGKGEVRVVTMVANACEMVTTT